MAAPQPLAELRNRLETAYISAKSALADADDANVPISIYRLISMSAAGLAMALGETKAMTMTERDEGHDDDGARRCVN